MSEAAVLMSWHFVISDDNYLHSGDGVQSTEPWRQRPHPSSSINLAAKLLQLDIGVKFRHHGEISIRILASESK